MILTSPSENVLTRIYSKTRLTADMPKDRYLFAEDRCLLNREITKMKKILEKDIFVIGGRRTADLVLTMIFLFEDIFKKLFISDSIYNYPQVSFESKLLIPDNSLFLPLS